ncbi:hypothetical protein [Flavobacterium sp. Root420]|uniref:hypothetical protein n=1 Tax=Flavobacterium sp. Root420 TaxID=1736533 RepID=UPI0006F21421|nr:hypothetical protein [Flavobacterium sp. Root420]KQW98634.1 hypothetical protein ASC72_14135 [Flavobacterium sp. Root420]
MKKILCLFGALSIALMTSCSSDDSSTDVASETLLPKKMVETTVENGQSGSITYTITYDGNKLKDIALSDASRSVYTYTGDVITKVELYRSSVLYSTDVYAYENGKLVSKITTKAFSTSPQQKLTFVYNANGTVNANESEISNKVEIKYDTTTLYTFSNGNIVSSEYINGERDKITSTFDDKKSPFTNVTGVKLLLNLDETFDFYSANNELTTTTVSYDSTGKVTHTETLTATNKYNANNFLTEIFVGDAKNSEKFEFTY